MLCIDAYRLGGIFSPGKFSVIIGILQFSLSVQLTDLIYLTVSCVRLLQYECFKYKFIITRFFYKNNFIRTTSLKFAKI